MYIYNNINIYLLSNIMNGIHKYNITNFAVIIILLYLSLFNAYINEYKYSKSVTITDNL